MSPAILIIEDEKGLVRTLQDRLARNGYSVSSVNDGVSGLDCAMRQRFDMIILDLMLPGLDGLSVCRRLRESGSSVPILMLTARRQAAEKVIGLKAGADDYLAKPFQMPELLARVDALLRRTSVPAEAKTKDSYHFGGVHIDLRRMEVFRNGKPIPVSPKEFRLLRYFADHAGETLSRDEILREVWGYSLAASSRTVDVHVTWLRQKLEEDIQNPKLILTVAGLGYKFAKTNRG